MKRLIAGLVIAAASLVGLGSAAQAQSVTICHSVHVQVQDQVFVDEGCQTLPPGE